MGVGGGGRGARRGRKWVSGEGEDGEDGEWSRDIPQSVCPEPSPSGSPASGFQRGSANTELGKADQLHLIRDLRVVAAGCLEERGERRETGQRELQSLCPPQDLHLHTSTET